MGMKAKAKVRQIGSGKGNGPASSETLNSWVICSGNGINPARHTIGRWITSDVKIFFDGEGNSKQRGELSDLHHEIIGPSSFGFGFINEANNGVEVAIDPLCALQVGA
jgi:hypothetical protein